MINFFRKTRKKMADDNKPMKYMRYAIGEIVLVVIGILIALQINNWNENRKQRIEEIKILTNLRDDLEKTVEEVDASREFNEVTIEEINKIENYSKSGLGYSDELDYSFGVFQHFYSIYITSGSYNTLQTMGLGIISNDSLKRDIPRVFETIFADFADYIEDENTLKHIIVTPFFAKYIRYTDKSVYMAKPNDYNSLILNDEFLNLLSVVKRQRKRGVEKYKANKIPINKLIEDISTELDSRN